MDIRLFKYLFGCFLMVNIIFGDVFEECSSVGEHMYMASSKSCAQYVYCNGDESYEGECPDGDYFSEVLQLCDFMENVKCRQQLNAFETTKLDLNESQPSQFNNTTLYVDEFQSESTSPSPIPVVTNPSSVTTFSATTIATLPTLITTNVATVAKITCPVIDDPNNIVFRRNPKSCSEYFVCYHGEPFSMHCSSMLHFNEHTGKCDRAENVRCLLNTITAREQCLSHTVDIFPHPTNCNYFYYCRNGYLLLQQCPFLFGWDFEKRSCVVLNQARCYGNSNAASIG